MLYGENFYCVKYDNIDYAFCVFHNATIWTNLRWMWWSVSGVKYQTGLIIDLSESADNIAVTSEFSELTDYSYGFPRDIETFCGIKKSGNPAINIINKFKDGTVPPEKRAEVVQIFKNLISQKQQ